MVLVGLVVDARVIGVLDIAHYRGSEKTHGLVGLSSFGEGVGEVRWFFLGAH